MVENNKDKKRSIFEIKMIEDLFFPPTSNNKLILSFRMRGLFCLPSGFWIWGIISGRWFRVWIINNINNHVLWKGDFKPDSLRFHPRELRVGQVSSFTDKLDIGPIIKGECPSVREERQREIFDCLVD